MKQHGFKRIRPLIAVGVLTLACYTMFPTGTRSRPNARRASCQSTLKQVALALKQYSADFDGAFPSIRSKGLGQGAVFGWVDAVAPYARSMAIFQCPAEGHSGQKDPRKSDFTDYWFNTRLSGKRFDYLKTTQCIILAGEGNDGTDVTNARYNMSTLPLQWVADSDSPANRHLEGANYAFADGHVKWIRPTRISNEPPNGKNCTFAIR
jgi:prepilin-type processing-associated H-X9-DG protein